MFGRCIALTLWVFALYCAYAARAQAAGPVIRTPARSLLTRAVPPAPALDKPSGLGGTITRFFESIRPSMPREKTDREREASVTGIRAKGIHAFGASLAGLGVGVGATMALTKEKGSTLAFTVGPRLFPGGGGVGIGVKW